jgi:acetoacetate decarboxylase
MVGTLGDFMRQHGMPFHSPTYPSGPYRFINREYFFIWYQTDPAEIRAHLPAPLEPDGSNTVVFEVIRMPDSTGFGDYTESGIVIPAIYKGEKVQFTSQMYLDCEPPISGGREIWGFPKKLGYPTLHVEKETLVGRLKWGEDLVALATMGYKHHDLTENGARLGEIEKMMMKPQVNYKMIPDVNGSPKIEQLVAYNLQDIHIKGAWSGPARLHLVPHVQASMADLPVHKIERAMHVLLDCTLPYGKVLHDYRQ